MKRCLQIAFGLFALGSLLLGGCSSLSVKESWHKTSGQAHQYKKRMILAIANDEGRRVMFENIMVDEVGRHGVTAVASHTLV
ncbi:hypothetical protein EG829_31325, partial [bacterium]|nr:hypothetical protein [bacterium]